MSLETLLRRILIPVSAFIVLSGLAQMLAPRQMLGILAPESPDAAAHFFATIGMFMIGFGGVFLHALLSGQPHPIIALWASLQKFGAFALIGIGVWNGTLGSMAMGVAWFDLLSGLLALLYWRKISG